MPITFQHATLDNGLTIIAETSPSAHSSACGFFVKAGARDEAADVMGVSHFLEHMMFKGTDRRSAEDVNREFDELGASYNAYTSTEMTCFYANVLPEYTAPAIDLLSDILRPALRDDDFNQEKNVILEEIAMYKDNPFWVLYEEAAARHYRANGLGHRVLGLEDTINPLSSGQMRHYFEHRYSADNTVVALAGKVDFDACVKQISDACGAWARTGATRDAAEPPVGAGEFELRDENVMRAYLLALAPAPPVQSEQRYAAALLARALGDDDNSRLHWALVEPGLADEASAQYSPHDGSGTWFVYASCSPERADEVWSIARREIDAVVDQLEKRDLERLCNLIATEVTTGGERPGGRMQRIGRLWTYLDAHLELDEELERINAVTIDDVRACAQQYPLTPQTVGRLLPQA